MDSNPVDTAADMYAENVDMDKYNLEHIIEKDIEMQHVQHEVKLER
jgi:hypothetical protein